MTISLVQAAGESDQSDDQQRRLLVELLFSRAHFLRRKKLP